MDELQQDLTSFIEDWSDGLEGIDEHEFKMALYSLMGEALDQQRKIDMKNWHIDIDIIQNRLVETLSFTEPILIEKLDFKINE